MPMYGNDSFYATSDDQDPTQQPVSTYSGSEAPPPESVQDPGALTPPGADPGTWFGGESVPPGGDPNYHGDPRLPTMADDGSVRYPGQANPTGSFMGDPRLPTVDDGGTIVDPGTGWGPGTQTFSSRPQGAQPPAYTGRESLTPPGLPQPPSSADPYANYNPELGKAPQQTYGGGQPGRGGAGGDVLAAQGFQRIEGTRFVVGPDGDIYVTDPGGYLNPNVSEAKGWQDLQHVQQNAMQRFDPFAMEKLTYAQQNAGALSGHNLSAIGGQAIGGPEVANFQSIIGGSPLGADAYKYTAPYQKWAGDHNAEAQRLGIPGQAVNVPTAALPMEQVFPAIKEFTDLLAANGATGVRWNDQNHASYQMGSNSPIIEWLAANGKPNFLTGDTPIGKVLQDIALLKEVTQQRQQSQSLAGSAASARSRFGGGTSRDGGGGGGQIAGGGQVIDQTALGGGYELPGTNPQPGRYPDIGQFSYTNSKTGATGYVNPSGAQVYYTPEGQPYSYYYGSAKLTPPGVAAGRPF